MWTLLSFVRYDVAFWFRCVRDSVVGYFLVTIAFSAWLLYFSAFLFFVSSFHYYWIAWFCLFLHKLVSPWADGLWTRFLNYWRVRCFFDLFSSVATVVGQICSSFWNTKLVRLYVLLLAFVAWLFALSFSTSLFLIFQRDQFMASHHFPIFGYQACCLSHSCILHGRRSTQLFFYIFFFFLFKIAFYFAFAIYTSDTPWGVQFKAVLMWVCYWCATRSKDDAWISALPTARQRTLVHLPLRSTFQFVSNPASVFLTFFPYFRFFLALDFLLFSFHTFIWTIVQRSQRPHRYCCCCLENSFKFHLRVWLCSLLCYQLSPVALSSEFERGLKLFTSRTQTHARLVVALSLGLLNL